VSLTVQPDGWTRAEWLAWRQGGVGGSDVAGLLGLSRWASPLSIYYAKTTPVSDGEASEAARWGTLLEQPIAREWEVRTGLHAVGEQALAVDDSAPWRRATLDALVAEHPLASDELPAADSGTYLGTLQIKTTGAFGWDEIPLAYQVQVQWELAVTGLPQAWLAVLHGGQRLVVHELPADPDVQTTLRRVVDQFWHEHVLTGVEPGVDGSAATADALRARWPESTDTQVELDADAVDAVRELAAAKDAVRAAEQRVTALENAVKAALQDSAAGMITDAAGELRQLVSWRTESAGARLDTAALRAAHPDLYDAFAVPAQRRVLRITRGALQ
jgi:putative phage-type endonuclease